MTEGTVSSSVTLRRWPVFCVTFRCSNRLRLSGALGDLEGYRLSVVSSGDLSKSAKRPARGVPNVLAIRSAVPTMTFLSLLSMKLTQVRCKPTRRENPP